jgi:hypothetical protein
MITDGEVVSFLVENAGPTSVEAQNLTRAWEALERLPPKIMGEVHIPITVYVRPPPPPDAGLVDAGDGEPEPIGGGGCSCLSSDRLERSSYTVWMFLVLFLAVARLLMLPTTKRVR